MKAANERLARSIGERNPELGALLTEHIAANYGELLPHLYMGEVTEWLVGAVASGRQGDVKDLLAVLEKQFENEESVRELITVSFLENLPVPGEPESSIRDLLGPVLRTELQRHEGRG
jgi:hypothetical protein